MVVTRSQKFFRYVWRINAVLILVAAAAAICGVVALVVSEIQSNIRQHAAVAAAPRVVPSARSSELHLNGFTNVPSTSVYEAKLTSERGGAAIEISSGGVSDTRNILFIDLTTGNGRWLLPSDDQMVTADENVEENSPHEERKSLARVMLVKPYATRSEAAVGRLLIMDAAAEHVTEIASGVQNVHGVTLTPAGQIALLFERDRKYEVALIDKTSLRKISERPIAVPELKTAAR
jgi:hypothetical protein